QRPFEAKKNHSSERQIPNCLRVNLLIVHFRSSI
ncbi:MAG: hypothetical protein ACI8TX_003431, partial [Hyphomicrobiaceae bacterium]